MDHFVTDILEKELMKTNVPQDVEVRARAAVNRPAAARAIVCHAECALCVYSPPQYVLVISHRTAQTSLGRGRRRQPHRNRLRLPPKKTTSRYGGRETRIVETWAARGRVIVRIIQSGSVDSRLKGNVTFRQLACCV